ncbi:MULTISPECIES: hypothetical protein [Providencia]|uniref:hypothetical protein n=1 Tax=Providencia TaxID=586 RepID=UPI00111D43FF|nr:MULTISPECIES: hypothetical protein [Providencia]TNV04402.1 hypothetical protein FH869_05790 [Providencia rettgeri]
MKNKTSELEDLYLKAFNIKRSSLIRRINQIKLMGWEQIILVALYAREQYQQDINNFHGRMAFVDAILAPDFKTILPKLLNLLDSGKSFLSIIEEINKNYTSWGIPINIYKALIHRLEEKHVAFPANYKQHLYSYLAIYTALTRFIHICQNMLNKRPSDQLCDNIIHKLLYDLFSQEIRFRELGQLLQTHELTDHELTDIDTSLESLLKMQIKAQKSHDDIILLIDTQLAHDLEESFTLFFYNSIHSDNHSMPPTNASYSENKFPSWVKHAEYDRNSDEVVIKLDFSSINNLMLMGQKNEIGKLLASILHEKILNKHKLPFLGVQTNDKASIIEWQQNCNVLGINRLDEIPSRIAGILFHDFSKIHIPIYSASKEINLSNYQKINHEQAKLLTTLVISCCLFHNQVPWKLNNNSLNKLSVTQEGLSKLFEESNELPMLADPLMQVWANNELARMLSRFKKPLREFKNHINDVERNIRTQMSKSLQTAFPLQPSFPTPLWIDVIKKAQ